MLIKICRCMEHAKSSFSKRDKRHSKRKACKVNAKYIDYVLEKSFTHIYIFMSFHTHIYICTYL